MAASRRNVEKLDVGKLEAPMVLCAMAIETTTNPSPPAIPPKPEFHLPQNGNSLFTLCFQGRGDFMPQKWGISNVEKR